VEAEVTAKDLDDAALALRGHCMMDVLPNERKGHGGTMIATKEHLVVTVTMPSRVEPTQGHMVFFELFHLGGGTWRLIGEGDDFDDPVRCVLTLKERAEARDAAKRLGGIDP
jgi:hypothetical protein